MFGWLKNKFNSYLPSDINKGFMSSYFCKIKLGNKLTVPENMVCFLHYRDKLYLELPAGTHILDANNLKALCERQFKKEKQKKVYADLFFVNLKAFSRTVEFKYKIPVNNRSTKLIINSKFEMQVTDAGKFNKFIQSEMASPNVEKTDGVVEGYFEDFLRNYFLRKELDSYTLSSSMENDLKNKATAFFAEFGGDLISFQITFKPLNKKETISESIKEEKPISIFNQTEEKQDNKEEKTNFSILENSSMLNTNTYDNNANKSIPQNKSTQLNSSNLCPKCRNKIVKNSWYCHRCGYKLK